MHLNVLKPWTLKDKGLLIHFSLCSYLLTLFAFDAIALHITKHS